SEAKEKWLIRLGLLQHNVLHHKKLMEIYKLKPVRAIAWVAERAKVNYARAAMLSFGSWAGSSWQERRNAFFMRRIFANGKNGGALIEAPPEQQPYRNEAEIRSLFTRLAIPIKQFEIFSSCYIAQI